MKRVLLIAGGTVGGLGAVLSITPPALSSNGLSAIAGASADTSIPTTESSAALTTSAATATPTAAPVATKKATTATKKATTTKKSTTTTAPKATTATPAPAATKAATGVSGSFTGDAINIGYGMMQVQIVVSNGKITDAVIVQAPAGRNQRWTDMAVPNLRQQTLSAQSAAITGVSGASYTSYGWYKSLISALQKAGMSTGV